MFKIFSFITLFLCIPLFLLAEQPGTEEPVFSLEHISIITSEEIINSGAKNLSDLF